MIADQDRKGCLLGIAAVVLTWAALIVTVMVWFEAMACLGFLQSR